MTYNAAIIFKGEDTHEKPFPTLQDAVDFIQFLARGCPKLRARINGKEVILRGGVVVDGDGEPLCTNETWQSVFAEPSRAILPAPDLLGDVKEQMDRIFRPRSTRGSAPTNPATLMAKGQL